MRFERMTWNFRVVIRIIMVVFTVIVESRASMLFIIKENRVSKKHLSRKAREFLLSCFPFFTIINL